MIYEEALKIFAEICSRTDVLRLRLSELLEKHDASEQIDYYVGEHLRIANNELDLANIHIEN